MNREDIVRDILFRLTAPIKDPDVQGAVFGAALILSDHLFNLLDRLTPTSNN